MRVINNNKRTNHNMTTAGNMDNSSTITGDLSNTTLLRLVIRLEQLLVRQILESASNYCEWNRNSSITLSIIALILRMIIPILKIPIIVIVRPLSAVTTNTRLK